MLNKLLPEFTVSEISEILKHTLEDNFSHIRVRGEVSGLKLHPSGTYFTLKDANSELRAVCWKGVANTLEFKPEEGLEVIVTGKISYYRSSVQISVIKLEHAGVGALLAMLEKRKQMFAAEGLFDQIRKQPLPRFPKVVGVITSETGAVIKDILHRIKDRYPLHVLIWNVQVQGTEAAPQVAAAIDGFNNLPDTLTKPDVLIVARGGGSIEDLWAFNEEIVVRAVANSKIPLISAVGHETDTTLIDYVSDLRAPTPTAAAEIVVPVLQELKSTLIITKKRLSQTLPKMIELEQMRLDKIKRFMDSFVTLLLAKLDNQQQSIANLSHRLHRTQKNNLQNFTNKLSSLRQLLESYHYKKVLARGFAIIRDPISDKLITSKKEIPSSIEIEFSDGAITFPNKKQTSLF